MSKENSTSSSGEATFTVPWWAKMCRILLVVLILPTINMLLGAVGGILVNWLSSAGGVVASDNSPLRQLANNWQMSLLLGIIFSLFCFILWMLSRRQVPGQVLPTEQDRTYMLKRLESIYHSRCISALEGISWMELRIRKESGSVLQNEKGLTSFLRGGNELAPGTSIQQIYEQAQGGLLLLGNSGAGKSLQLFSLAHELAEQAQKDLTLPFPVILSLSSWAIRRPPFLDWCCEQMARIYDVSYQLCRQWLQCGHIILLLDDLDNMEKDACVDCIAAINEYHHEHVIPLVVCSRVTEYARAAGQQPLHFQDAIIIQPLPIERVIEYLTNMGSDFDALRAAIKKNQALRELATNPLMLCILMRTYRGIPVRKLSRQEAALRKQVWESYVNHCMAKQEEGKKSSSWLTCLAWLHWLAGQMLAHNLTVFYPECLQPDWLPEKARKVYTWVALKIPGALIGGFAGVLTAPLMITLNSTLLIQYSLCSALLGMVFSTLRKSAPVRATFSILRSQFLERFALSSLLGCLWALLGWLNSSFLETASSQPLQWLFLVTSGISIGLSCFLLMSVLPRLATKDALSTIGSPCRLFRSHVRQAEVLCGRCACVLLVMLVLGLGVGLSIGMAQGISYGLGCGLSYGLSYGFLCVPLYFILVTPGKGIFLTERGSSWINLLHSLSVSKHLRGPLAVIGMSLLLLGCTEGLKVGTSQTWDYGLSQGLSWGLSQGLSWFLIWILSYWSLLWILRRVSRAFINEHHRSSFNRRIHNALRNSLFMSIVCAIVIGGVSLLSWGFGYELSYALHYGLSWGFSYELRYEMSYGFHSGLSQGLSYAWLFAVSGGVLAGVLSGGLVVLRHYAMRVLLWRIDLFPRNVQSFLADAAAKGLLQPLQGGYTFIHRQLLEYLADQDIH